MPILIEAQHISKRFTGVQALQDVNITINKGEVRCLVGENGSGKSTLIKIIAGVHKPDSGELVINNKQFKYLRPMDAIREGIQVIYQDFSLFPNLSIAENLALNTLLEHKRRIVNRREVRRIAAGALEQIGVDMELDKLVADLSVADKQLVAISRALLHDAKLIIMDEPTTALTRREVDSLLKIINNLQAEGISVLFVSHKLQEVLDISEQITVLRNGANVAEGPVSDFDHDKLVLHMTGRELSKKRYFFQPLSSTGDNLLQISNLCKKGGFENIDLGIQKGEIVGLAGLLGSGRTELAMSLFGLNPPDSGSIKIETKPVKIRSVRDAINNGIAYVPEDRLTEGLFLEQPVSRNIFISILHSLLNRFGLIDREKADKQVAGWIKELNINTPSPDVPASSLSGGNQQKIVLAKWLATKAKLLILNGPTVGVDIGAKTDILDKIRALAKQGLTILVISDDPQELLQTCNRIIIMHKGKFTDRFETAGNDEDSLMSKLSALN